MSINDFMFERIRSQIFKKIGALKNFAKLTRTHLCRSLFLNKVAGLQPAILSKKKLQPRCFLANFEKF